MSKKAKEYDYLLHLYARVNKYLNDDRQKIGELQEVIVSFCIVVERILKMKLHTKNPLLVFDVSRFKNDDGLLSTLALGTEDSVETINIYSALARFEILFKKQLSKDEVESIKNIYNIRNKFVHSYCSEDEMIADKEGVVTQMSFIWPKISKITQSILGKERILSIKPKKTYTEEEFKKAMLEEVMKKIRQPVKNIYGNIAEITLDESTGYFNTSSKQCPRCGNLSFNASDSYGSSGFGIGGNVSFFEPAIYSSVIGRGVGGFELHAQLYKCSKCNLELTQNDYDLFIKETSKTNNSRQNHI
jgi:hypothetical protein